MHANGESLQTHAGLSLVAAVQFVKKFWFRFITVSSAMVIPCLWHRHIEAGDLASHAYNAWLAQLIETGHAPGLYFASQWNNILFDLALWKLGNWFGLQIAEKIAVSCCVLIFFWGVFSLISAVTGRAPWFLSPAIAMLAYGYVFNMGFFNYYLSVGLACFALALFWREKKLDLLFGALLMPFTVLAHPLGFLWLLGTIIYKALATRLGRSWRLLVPTVAIAAVAILCWHLARHADYQADWPKEPFYLFNGADQLALYSGRYLFLAGAAFLVGLVFFVVSIFLRGREAPSFKSLRLPIEFYLVSLAVISLLPQNFRPAPEGAWIGLLVSRLTLLSAIFGLCVLGSLNPRKWHLASFAPLALLFFVFLYQDTARLNRLEANSDTLVRNLPSETRVLNTIFAPPDSRISFIGHVADRACIGHCFSYGNYEPSSGQFRIRVRPGSPIVTSSSDDTEDMGAGSYEVQEEDLPLKEIYQCDEADLTRLCLRDLAAGEKNGRLGYQP
ncbi:MAG: hypothetical protein NVS9B13_23520 [Candidatus Acidiferrum sp.]